MPPSVSCKGRNTRDALRGSTAARRLSACAMGDPRRSGWHWGEGCARAVDRPRQSRADPGAGERTGRRARGPDPGTGPAAPPELELAQTLARNDDAHRRSLPGFALHFAESSQESDALAHSEQTEVSGPDPGFSPLFSLEAVAVVADVDLESLFIFQQGQPNLMGGRMFLHVVQGFDGNAVERRLRLPREGTRIVERF